MVTIIALNTVERFAKGEVTDDIKGHEIIPSDEIDYWAFAVVSAFELTLKAFDEAINMLCKNRS